MNQNRHKNRFIYLEGICGGKISIYFYLVGFFKDNPFASINNSKFKIFYIGMCSKSLETSYLCKNHMIAFLFLLIFLV